LQQYCFSTQRLTILSWGYDMAIYKKDSMQIYNGKLVEGIICEHKSEGEIEWDASKYAPTSILKVLHDGEWKLFKM
jgi:hypothetical protein